MPAKKKRSRGISTGYDPKTGKVGYSRSVGKKKPPANYASSWAKKYEGNGKGNAHH
jgi:hypothetical protein